MTREEEIQERNNIFLRAQQLRTDWDSGIKSVELWQDRDLDMMIAFRKSEVTKVLEEQKAKAKKREYEISIMFKDFDTEIKRLKELLKDKQ